MKKTLISIHLFPHEIEMMERLSTRLSKSCEYLDDNDDVTMFVSLNLNPTLIDWDASKLKQDYFVDKFNSLTNNIPLKNINTIHTDSSLMGTTQHKRVSITKKFDQYIFCDPDIIFPDTLLKNQLNLSYQLSEELYIISPSIPRWWDSTWDSLCDSRFLNAQIGSAQLADVIDSTENQDTDNVSVRIVNPLKYGCGMHTLYSKPFWDMVGIPESFGGYGPEDTFSMTVGNIINSKIPTNQYVLDGVYITEDYNRIPGFGDSVCYMNKKEEFRTNATKYFQQEVTEAVNRILTEQHK